eukprot:m.725235 g.725235  ORF g.725235 m.725235 type:complete len:508 (-) comp23028_c0_seq3:1298-2821(-)
MQKTVQYAVGASMFGVIVLWLLIASKVMSNQDFDPNEHPIRGSSNRERSFESNRLQQEVQHLKVQVRALRDELHLFEKQNGRKDPKSPSHKVEHTSHDISTPLRHKRKTRAKNIKTIKAPVEDTLGISPDLDHPGKCGTSSHCRRNFVREMMKVAWAGYHDHAWGANELDPVQQGPHHNGLFGADSGATIIDAIDTLHVMGLKDEEAVARSWIASTLHFDHDHAASVFEVNIRYLGGLLSMYGLTGDSLYKDKAVDLGTHLMPAFNTPSGIPWALINLKTGKGEKFGWVHCNCAILSEFGTLQLEFTYLSSITGDAKYKNAVDKAMNLVLGQDRSQTMGMVPNFVDYSTGHLVGQDFRLGALGDSFYEYVFKYWRFMGNTNTWNSDREVFDGMMRNVDRHMVRTVDGHVMIGDLANGQLNERMDHLACFLGGTLMMASVGAKYVATPADAHQSHRPLRQSTTVLHLCCTSCMHHRKRQDCMYGCCVCAFCLAGTLRMKPCTDDSQKV